MYLCLYSEVFTCIWPQPENILLDGNLKFVKISDFGFSTILNDEEGLSGTSF